MLVPLLATTLFLTSGLLFAVEPLIAKGLLPSLGGGAAVPADVGVELGAGGAEQRF